MSGEDIYIIWPQKQWVKAAQIEVWFDDAVANEEIAEDRKDAYTISEKADALADAGIITRGSPR